MEGLNCRLNFRFVVEFWSFGLIEDPRLKLGVYNFVTKTNVETAKIHPIHATCSLDPVLYFSLICDWSIIMFLWKKIKHGCCKY